MATGAEDEIIDTFTPAYRGFKPDVSVIMPVHNEVECIEKVVTEFYGELSRRLVTEIVCCEDGSTDGTKDVLRALTQKLPMKVILGAERKGYSKAIIDGLKLASAEYVLFVDSDGQHLPQDFWKLYEHRLTYDVVSGCRVGRSDPIHRRIMSSVFQRLARILFKLPRFRDVTGPYKLVRADVAKRVSEEYKYMVESFWTEFTIRAYKKGYRMLEVPVTHRSRIGGDTRVYKPTKIPKIVLRQLRDLLKLWFELR